LQDLDEAVRRFLAWKSILADKETLNLDPHQVRQAETQHKAADSSVTARLPETYLWLLVPNQTDPQTSITWQPVRVSGSDELAVRASRKLRSDESLVTSLGSTILREHLDDVPLWRGDHVAIRQLVEDFAKYLYLPRIKDSVVLFKAIQDGLALLTWEQDTFAYAESYDEESGRYRGLRTMQQVSIVDGEQGLVVRPDVAKKQLEAETSPINDPSLGGAGGAGAEPPEGDSTSDDPTPVGAVPKRANRYHGSVSLDPTRTGRDASVIADEVIAHLSGLLGAEVKVTLEIEADIPEGAPDQVVRTVTENSRTLKFEASGFEEE
jgi:hypothetical protein